MKMRSKKPLPQMGPEMRLKAEMARMMTRTMILTKIW